MKVLVITQKIDKNDDILGFFYGWLNELAKKIDKIYVLALEVKNADLAKNIEVYSLRRENGNSKLRRFLKFNQALLNLSQNKKIDIIFIHMCPEYAILAWPYAKLKNIPIVMWYAHGHTNMKLRIAHLLVDKIVTPSSESFRIKSGKVAITGHGINVQKFSSQSGIPQDPEKYHESGKKIILSVGRISPIKNYETLIKAADILINQRNIKDLKFQIVGGIPLKSQNKYLDFLKDMVGKYKLEDYLYFVGAVPYVQIQNYYRNCDLFVSASNTGSLDKAVLEAMASARTVLISNEAFADLLKKYSDILIFKKNNPDSLAGKILHTLALQDKDRDNLNYSLRESLAKDHGLDKFINNILAVFIDTINK